MKTFPGRQLTVECAHCEREDPEEERECQSGTQHDHINHHVDGLLHQDIIFRVHAEGRPVLQDRRTESRQCLLDSFCCCKKTTLLLHVDQNMFNNKVNALILSRLSFLLRNSASQQKIQPNAA